MFISVLTPCFNAASTIRHTLDSFVRQTHLDRELIVLDGGSRDGTQAIVEGYASEGVVLVSEPDRGMYDALNKGLARFRGDAVGALNADDAYHDDRVLERIASALRLADIVWGHLEFVTEHETGRVVRRWRSTPRPEGGFRSGWMPPHPTFYVRRAVAEAVGAFDLGLATAADYDWMMRAVELHGFRTGLVDDVLVTMRQGGKSTRSLSAHVRHNWEAAQARRRRLGTPMLDVALLAKPGRKVGQFFARNG